MSGSKKCGGVLVSKFCQVFPGKIALKSLTENFCTFFIACKTFVIWTSLSLGVFSRRSYLSLSCPCLSCHVLCLVLGSGWKNGVVA